MVEALFDRAFDMSVVGAFFLARLGRHAPRTPTSSAPDARDTNVPQAGTAWGAGNCPLVAAYVSDKQPSLRSLASNRCIVYLFSGGYRNDVGLFAESI